MPLERQTKRDFVAEHVRGIPRSGIRDFFDIVQSMDNVVSLGIGEPGFVTPWHIREAAIFALERGRTSYTSNFGLIKLRKAISAYLKDVFHIEYDPNSEILVTVGVSEGLDIALRAIINPGDEVLYHEPCYVSYHPSVQLVHGVGKAIRTRTENKFSLTAEDVAASITPRTKAIMLNFPTNPTRATLSADEVDKIARASIDKAMLRVHQYSMLCAPILSQEAAIEALEHGLDDIAVMREQYRLRRNFIVKSFNEIGMPCHMPNGAFYSFPSIRETGLTSREFAVQLLEQQRVAVVPGDAFGPSGEGHVRASYCGAMTELEKAIDGIGKFVRNLKK